MSYPTKKLGEIALVQAGGTPYRGNQDFWGGTIPWLKISELNNGIVSLYNETITEEGLNNSSAKLFKKGTILYSIFATIGKMGILDIDATTNQAIAGITANENIVDKMYLFFSLKYYTNILIEQSIGVAQNNINSTKLKALPIPLPTIPTQKLIVQKLDTAFKNIDESINITKKNIENIEELNKSVLGGIFEDGEYEVVKLNEFSTFGNKTTIPNINDEYNYIGLENISQGTGKLIEFNKTIGSKIKSNKVQFNEGDILYGKLRPYLNKVLVTEFSGIATTEILPITCGNKLYNYYLGYFLRTDKFVKLANSNISGARMPRVTTQFIKNEVLIPLAPIEKQKEIVLYLDEIFEKNKVIKEGYKKKLKELEEMKQSILKEAFEGRLIKE